jgi:[ribosomal protein S18]-alanine N-acetyltransferase
MTASPASDSALRIRPLAGPGEAETCARLMAGSEPWLTLGRSYEASLRLVQDPTREVYVAECAGAVGGFVVLCLTGAFVGYIQTVCVSSFNPGARRLYERLGYAYIGELPDYLVAGHAELLFRKSRGPWSEFVEGSSRL